MIMVADDEYCTIAATNTNNNNLNIPDLHFDYQYSPLDISDYMMFDEALVDGLAMPSSNSAQLPAGVLVSSPPPPPVVVVVADGGGSPGCQHSTSCQVETTNSGGGGDNSENSRSKTSEEASKERGTSYRIAFRTKSDVEILDDGFRWRKYGRKSVKNSPNPRNYYRCSIERCSVKKRIERDPREPSYVITTYEGVHNHASTDVVYYATQDNKSGRYVVSGCHHINQSS